MIRCSGVTKAGKRCSVTSTSNFTDDQGRDVADLLRNGSEFCRFHAKPFCTKPVQIDEYDNMVVIILDLETTGVAVS